MGKWISWLAGICQHQPNSSRIGGRIKYGRPYIREAIYIVEYTGSAASLKDAVPLGSFFLKILLKSEKWLTRKI